MRKIRLTKNELKNNKESLKRFNRFLPVLQLKKRQLQREIIKVSAEIKSAQDDIKELTEKTVGWVDVFAEGVPIREFLGRFSVKTETGSIAGIDFPVFAGVEFEENSYDFMVVPYWVDSGLEAVKEMITIKGKISVYHKQMDILKEELRITNQRINLFEKVKIPEAKENIRVINIYLGELRTAEVVRGKIAKAKIGKNPRRI